MAKQKRRSFGERLHRFLCLHGFHAHSIPVRLIDQHKQDHGKWMICGSCDIRIRRCKEGEKG